MAPVSAAFHYVECGGQSPLISTAKLEATRTALRSVCPGRVALSSSQDVRLPGEGQVRKKPTGSTASLDVDALLQLFQEIPMKATRPVFMIRRSLSVMMVTAQAGLFLGVDALLLTAG